MRLLFTLLTIFSFLSFNTSVNAQCTHTIILTDTWGDGWNGGTVSVSVGGIVVLNNITIASGAGPLNFNFTASTGQVIRVYRTAAGAYPGEMRIRVINSTGTVVINTVQPVTGTATSGGTTGTASCAAPPPCTQNNVNLNISAGTYPGEVSWTLVNAGGTTVASGGAPYNQNLCLPTGCYTLNMNDSWGDGWNGSNYTFTLSGSTIATGTLANGTSGTAQIGIGTSCNVPTPPANDNCAGALVLSCGNTVTVNTANATNDAAGSALCGTTITTPGVWYRIVGNGQQMTISTIGLTTADTKLMVFSGSCAGLVCVGGNDDFTGLQSSVTWNSVNGTTYYVLAALFTGTGSFPMSLSCVTPCPVPSNDLCANAPILNLGTNNNQTHVGTGCGSTPNLGTYKDVWVAFTVPCGGMNVVIDFCGSTPVHNNAYLNIFSDCSFATFTSAANWNFTSCPDGNIRLYWNNVPAGTYYYPILIDPAWETNYTLNISGTPLHTPATAPTSISGTTTICGGQSTTLTLQGGSAGTNGTVQWFEGSCGSAVIGTANSITVAPTTNTTYFVRYISSCNTTACASVSVNLNSASTQPTLSGAGLICPNTTVNLVASGGTAGTGSQVAWYTGPNGTGSFLGFGNSFSFLPTSSSIVYARREGTCNTTVDASTSITLRDYVYAANNISSTNYCTDNTGWNHFYNGNDIILSVRGNLSSAGTVTALINDNANYFSALGNTALCASGINPGEAQFEMQRSWNVSYTGTLSGTYQVRYYFNPQERQDVIDAAAAYLAANPSCAYTYKYNASNSGWFWFKNNNVTYTAPSFDDNPNFALMSSTAAGTTSNGLTYTEISNITGFSGGTGGVVLLPGGFLPVEWLYFNAENQGNANRLLWATASEENALSFDVERSKDGSNFEKIGTKTAAGNSSVTNYYEFMDNNPQNGFNYYRIKLINTDGTEEFTEVKVLENKFSSDDFAVYPNPTTDIIHFNSTVDKAEDMKVEVLDILGRVVKTEIHKSVIGKNNVPLRIAELQAGAYSLRVTFLQSNRTNSAKFVKK